MDQQLEFAKNVIKGKIAELIFEFMFRNSGNTVIPFGYEYSQPDLAQHLSLLKDKKMLDTLRTSPDFILISKDKTEVYFVEVKYRTSIDPVEIMEMAEKTNTKWNPAWIFLATPQGFYLEPCNTIINNKGNIGKLYTQHVPQEVQDKYLELLKEFERPEE